MPRFDTSRSPLALGLALAASLGGGVQAADGWQGHYRYEYDGGRTAGGSGIAVTYDLAIGPPGTRGGCLLSSRGYQTDERIVCHADAAAETLSVTFHGYPDGKLTNRYGVALYKPGQVLFTLKRSGDGRLLTMWEALKPDEKASASGVFFEQAR